MSRWAKDDGRRKRAIAMAKENMTYRKIGELLGVTASTIHAWVDPAYAERRRRQIREKKAQRSEGGRPVRHRVEPPLEEMQSPFSVPKDRRDTTGSICGDPLPGRSALDLKRGTQ